MYVHVAWSTKHQEKRFLNEDNFTQNSVDDLFRIQNHKMFWLDLEHSEDHNIVHNGMIFTINIQKIVKGWYRNKT